MSLASQRKENGVSGSYGLIVGRLHASPACTIIMIPIFLYTGGASWVSIADGDHAELGSLVTDRRLHRRNW